MDHGYIIYMTYIQELFKRQNGGGKRKESQEFVLKKRRNQQERGSILSLNKNKDGLDESTGP